MQNSFKVKPLLDYNKSIQSRLNELCNPLKTLGISNFSYNKVTQDRRYFYISDHRAYMDLFFNLEIYNLYNGARGYAKSDTFNTELNTKTFLWNTNDSGLCINRKTVNMWNGASIYCFYKDFFEVWALGGTLEDTCLPNFIINNTALLHKYFSYFKSSAKDIIDITDRSKTIDVKFHDDPVKSIDDNIEKVNTFNRLITTNKHLISNGRYEFSLTSREIQCIVYKSQGLTAKEIARELEISYRTVEAYFNNIKMKSGMATINQVLSICKDEGLL